jgi:hypothetical protein
VAVKPRGIVQNPFVQIARVGVQRCDLPTDRFDHARVAMPDMGHVIVAIEISLAVRIPDPDAFAPHQMHRLVIKRRDIRPKEPGAPVDKIGNRGGHS